MCGRYLLTTPAAEIARIFGVDRVSPYDAGPRLNVAPTELIPIIRGEIDRESAARAVRVLTLAKWGLVPSWATDPGIGSRMINARSESVAEKPAFRPAFERRRCIIPADGFYEWRKITPRKKEPVLIRARGGAPIALAGLWERWRPRTGADAPWLETCTILTCAPNPLVEPIHDRMPVILEEGEITPWLDPREHDAARITKLLDPFPAEKLELADVKWSLRIGDDVGRKDPQPGLFGCE